MESKLLSQIRTVEERDRLLREIDLVLSSIYQKGDESTLPGLDRTLKTQVRLWVSDILRSEIPNDLQAQEAYLMNLKSEIAKLKVLQLKLSFEPTEVSLDKFHAYLNEILPGGAILDIEYDPSILGGAQITWGGEFRDFSLKRLFESEYEAKEKELLKIFYTK